MVSKLGFLEIDKSEQSMTFTFILKFSVLSFTTGVVTQT